MDKPSKVIPESVVTPLVGMRVAEVSENRNKNRLLRIGTVLEIIHYEGGAHYRIRFETLTMKNGGKEIWCIKKTREANNYYNTLKALSPLIGLRVAVTEEDGMQMGTVMEWVREDDETVGPPYYIEFDTTNENGL